MVAKVGSITGQARVRVFPALPWNYDFEAAPVGRPPLTWVGAGGKFSIADLGGNKALYKPGDIDLYHAARTYLGPTALSNYTIEADIMVGEKVVAGVHQMPDAGVINAKYGLTLLGNHQWIQLNVWQGALPTGSRAGEGQSLNKTIAYTWAPNKWYHLKLRVDSSPQKALIQGKVWPRDGNEPADWMVEMEDTLPNQTGSPGLFGESLVDPVKSPIYYDNVAVTANK